MKGIKILASIFFSIVSIGFTVAFIMLIFVDNKIEKLSCVCIICFTALWGLSLAFLAFISCGNETDKVKILSKDFYRVIEKICNQKYNAEAKSTMTEKTEAQEEKCKMCFSTNQVNCLEKCFKSYANALADI